MARRVSKVGDYLTPDGLQKLRDWSGQGATYEQIASKIGISEATFYNWLKKYPEIKEAVTDGDEVKKEIAIGSLFKLITGYKDTEVKVERYKLNGQVVEDNDKYPVKETITTKVIPPNPTAIIFWLKTRCGFSEKAVVEMQGQVGNPLAGVSTAELKDLVKKLTKDA